MQKSYSTSLFGAISKLICATRSIPRKISRHRQLSREKSKVKERYQEVFGDRNPEYLKLLLSDVSQRGLANVLADIEEGRSIASHRGWHHEPLAI